MALDNVLIMNLSQPSLPCIFLQDVVAGDLTYWPDFWDDFVVWYQNNNVLNYNNGILKFLPINKSTMCTLYVFIDIFVIDHLNKPVRMLVLSDV